MTHSSKDFTAVAERLVKIQPRLYGYLRSLIFDPTDAEDLLQEVCAAILKKASQYDTDRSFDAWVFGIARVEILRYFQNHERQALRFSDRTLDLLTAEATSESSAATRFTLAALDDCVAKLSKADREVIRLRYADDLTGKTIAEILQWSEAKVSRALNRIYTMLMLCIRQSQRQGGLA